MPSMKLKKEDWFLFIVGFGMIALGILAHLLGLVD